MIASTSDSLQNEKVVAGASPTKKYLPARLSPHEINKLPRDGCSYRPLRPVRAWSISGGIQGEECG